MHELGQAFYPAITLVVVQCGGWGGVGGGGWEGYRGSWGQIYAIQIILAGGVTSEEIVCVIGFTTHVFLMRIAFLIRVLLGVTLPIRSTLILGSLTATLGRVALSQLHRLKRRVER